jgi:hypothetical protein
MTTKPAAKFTTLRITAEFGEPAEVSASYLLDNWRNHREAQAVIREAMAGRSGSFDTPSGVVIIRPIA